MAVELVVPKVGESITEVQIVQWLVAEGDRVERDSNLAVIETDKATVELPAPVAGTLTKILVGPGKVAKVGDVIGYIEEGVAEAAKNAAGAAKKPAAEAKAEKPSDKPSEKPAEKSAASQPAAKSAAQPAQESKAAPGPVMPAAARILAEQGLAAADVKATGPGNRLLKEDVQRHVEAKAQAPLTAAPPAAAGDRSEETVPMSMLRKKVAERLVSAHQNAALLTTFNEIDMTAAMDLRKRHQDNFVKKYGTKLGFMSFFVKAAVDALKLVPQINAEIRGESIVYKRYYDIGVAVGGGKGLVVPIIRNAERLGFAQVELAIADFGKRAQANSLKL
ncbi:MAG: 2-oxoglutarate dehydrogenase, subunit, dihydrolipoamide succinyltransferase, partial [Verrucomicrobiales bacterium]|nr:2-oxoglutarate dehydrogenase, subunit, dihydrolipoamide succinyltransferase [Verrucomicrobiales bacterium]